MPYLFHFPLSLSLNCHPIFAVEVLAATLRSFFIKAGVCLWVNVCVCRLCLCGRRCVTVDIYIISDRVSNIVGPYHRHDTLEKMTPTSRQIPPLLSSSPSTEVKKGGGVFFVATFVRQFIGFRHPYKKAYFVTLTLYIKWNL